MSLDNDLDSILSFLNLPPVDSSLFDHTLFKLQLWLEEKIYSLPDFSIFGANMNIIIESLKKSFKFSKKKKLSQIIST